MTTSMPDAVDSFLNPGAATLESAAGYEHDLQHANANDALKAMERLLVGPVWINPRSDVYGAVGDGTTDDTAALQAAINAAGSTSAIRGAVVWLGDGDYAISSTLLLNKKSVRLVGTGWRSHSNPSSGTCIRWIGSAGTPMVRLQASWGSGLQNLRLIGDSSNKPSAAISMYNLSSDTNGTNYCYSRDIWIGPMSSYDSDSGICFTTGILFEGDNVNNDTNRFEHFNVRGCTTGVSVGSSQWVLNSFVDFTFSGCGTAVSAAADVTLRDVKFLSSSTVDIAITGGAHVSLESFVSEGAAKFCTPGNGSTGGRLTAKFGYFQAGASMSDAAMIDNQHNTASELNLECVDMTQNSPAFTPKINLSSPAGTASTKSIWIKGPTSILPTDVVFTTAASSSDIHMFVYEVGPSPFQNVNRGGSQDINSARHDFDGVCVKCAAPTTSLASIRLPHGTAPSSPTNGDMWTTTAGLYVRINGSTVGPLS